MKKMLAKLAAFSKKKALALLAVLGLVGSASAQESGSYQVPTAVTESITELQGAATSYASVIYPYIRNIGLAFVGIAVFYLLFRLWRRFAQGR